MFLLVGLGNPGEIYRKTRHNAGFMAVDFISNRYNFIWNHKSKFNADALLKLKILGSLGLVAKKIPLICLFIIPKSTPIPNLLPLENFK